MEMLVRQILYEKSEIVGEADVVGTNKMPDVLQ